MKNSPVFGTVIVVLLLISTTLSAQPRYATSGREFYIGFAQNYLPISQPGDSMQLMILSDMKASGSIEVPALKFLMAFSVVPGQLTTITLPSGNSGDSTVEITGSGTVVKGMAVHVTSDSDVTIVGVNHKQYSSDAFLAYPLKTCGSQYRAVCFGNCGALEGFPGTEAMPGEFLIASSHDSTVVTITPKALTTDGHRIDSSFAVRLDKGDVYQVQSDLSVDAGDLTGSLITSNNPIALYSGHARTEIPQGYKRPVDSGQSRNHVIEQLLPTDLWDTSAAIVPLANQDLQGLARIVAGHDSTRITIYHMGDTTQHFVLNAGQYYQTAIVDNASFITSSHPIEVAQYTHTCISGQGVGDPAMVMMPSLTHMDTSLAIAVYDNSVFVESDVTLILSARDSVLMLDGDTRTIPTTSNLIAPIAQSGFYYVSFNLSPGEHFISMPHPFAVMTYAVGVVDAYAYSGGMPVRLHPFSDVSALPTQPLLESRVYPNPTDGIVTIPSIASNAHVTITDELGRELNVAAFTMAGGQLDLSKMPSGVYLVIIETDGKRTMERVVKE